MNRESSDQLVGRHVAAVGAWAVGAVDGASRSRDSVVLATDNGLALHALDRELCVVADRAAPCPACSTTIIGAARDLFDARGGAWRGLDIVFKSPTPFSEEGQFHRYVVVAEGYGEYVVYAVPPPISLPAQPTWPTRPRAVRPMDYDQDWLWGARGILPILSPLSGEVRLAVASATGLDALFHDEGELHVASFDAEIASSNIAGIGGKEVWDFSATETDTLIVLELSGATHQFSSVIAEYNDGGIELYQCLKVEVPG